MSIGQDAARWISKANSVIVNSDMIMPTLDVLTALVIEGNKIKKQLPNDDMQLKRISSTMNDLKKILNSKEVNIRHKYLPLVALLVEFDQLLAEHLEIINNSFTMNDKGVLVFNNNELFEGSKIKIMKKYGEIERECIKFGNDLLIKKIIDGVKTRISCIITDKPDQSSIANFVDKKLNAFFNLLFSNYLKQLMEAN